MVVGLGGGETIGYLVEYLNETQKDVSVVTPSFVREQAGIQAVNGDTKDALNYEIGDMEAYVTKI